MFRGIKYAKKNHDCFGCIDVVKTKCENCSVKFLCSIVRNSGTEIKPVLSKKACKSCYLSRKRSFISEAKEVKDQTIYRIFARNWFNGFVDCSKTLDQRSRHNFMYLPDSDCPYYLEHIFHSEQQNAKQESLPSL